MADTLREIAATQGTSFYFGALANAIASSPLSPKLACKQLVASQVLAHAPGGVLLALDEVERIVGD